MAERLKDLFFTDKFVQDLGDALHSAGSEFNKKRFLKMVLDNGWSEMALKEKMHHVTCCIHDVLNQPYPQALDTLIQIAPQFSDFNASVFPDYVEMYGLEYWDLSMPALMFFTQFFSAEFAVRTFIIEDPEQAMKYMYDWAEDENEQVRRLASEGSRPRLPWGMALPMFKEDPSPILPIIEKLKNDPSETVRRSVANNLNDISKDHPEVVLELCERWYGEDPNTDRLVKHACRSLLKAGYKRALQLFGFGDPSQIFILDLEIDKRSPHIGDDIQISYSLKLDTKEPKKLRLEYAVFFMKAKGDLYKKVFQHSEKFFSPGTCTISKKHSFVDMSTRKHYPGEHKIAIIVNGVQKSEILFQLLPAEN